MNHRGSILGSRPAIVLVLTLGCVSQGAPTQPSEIEGILAATFSYLFEHNHAHSAAGPYQVICIGIGSSIEDPSVSLLNKLRAYSIPVRPASACTIEHDKTLRWGTTIERETDKPAILFVVHPQPETLSLELLKFEASYFEDSLSSAHYECYLRRESGGWTVKYCELMYIS